MPGIQVREGNLDINMVFISLPDWVDGGEFSAYLAEEGILTNPPEGGLMRFVTHYWVTREAVDRTAARIEAFMGSRGQV
jgi:threonine aldolase